jgi:hypothetical protein
MIISLSTRESVLFVELIEFVFGFSESQSD